MKKQLASLRDVAKLAGVSSGLVSVFFRNQTYRQGGSRIGVSDETARKIIAAARSLNFRPDNFAALIKLYPDAGGTAMLLGRNAVSGFASFYSEIFTGAAAAQQLELDLNLSTFDINADYLLHPELLPACATDNRTGKFLIVGGENYSLALALKRMGRSVCYILRESGLDGTYSIAPDWQTAVYDAARLLFRAGHRNIALIGESYVREEDGNHANHYYGKVYHTPLVLNGVRRAFSEFKLEFDPSRNFIINRQPDLSLPPTYFDDFMALPERPTAAICLCDSSAVRFTVLARSGGLDIPGDLSIIGFRGKEPPNDQQLTIYQLPLLEIGRLAIELLNSDKAEYGLRKLPFRFVQGTTVREL